MAIFFFSFFLSIVLLIGWLSLRQAVKLHVYPDAPANYKLPNYGSAYTLMIDKTCTYSITINPVSR